MLQLFTLAVTNFSCLFAPRVNVWGKQGRHSFVHIKCSKKRVWNGKYRARKRDEKADLLFSVNLNVERELFESLKVIESRARCTMLRRGEFLNHFSTSFDWTFSSLPFELGSNFSIFSFLFDQWYAIKTARLFTDTFTCTMLFWLWSDWTERDVKFFWHFF